MKFAKKTKKNNGFSLLEAVLSVAVVVIGIVAILPLVSSSLNESMDSRDQVIASMLTQEGAELVQNLRDNNWAQSQPTFNSFPPASSYARIDKDIPLDWSGGADYRLYLNAQNYYVHSVATPTKFLRRLSIVPISGGDTFQVWSVVIWNSTATWPTHMDMSDCNTATKCAYAEVELTKWAEK